MAHKPVPFSAGEESFTILVVPPFSGRFSPTEAEPEWMTQPHGRGTFEFQPDAEFQDAGNTIVLRLELPGVDVEDIEISTTDARITVGGQKRSEVLPEEPRTYGVLSLRIPRPDATRTQWKRIEIR